MTKANTLVIAKMVAVFAVAALALSTFAVAQAQAVSGCASMNRDLTIGSTGADVTNLQNFLISKGMSIPAGATGYFGGQTQAALAKYQASVGIAPAAGYFGPITRAHHASVCAGMGDDDDDDDDDDDGDDGGELEGGEGTLDVQDELGDVEDEVEEGEEDIQVVGVELEAEDSDIELERVDVDFDLSTGTGSDDLDDYLTEVSLWLDGEEIARLDVDEADEDDDVWSFRFNDLDSAIIREDDQAELYVAVSAVNNVDTGDIAKGLDVDLPVNAIRAVDAEGISETYVEAADVSANTFNVVEATTGDLTVSTSADSPDAQTLIVDEDDNTDDVLILAFDIEADEQAVVIEDLPVGFDTDETDLDQVISRAMLVMDGDVLDTVSITTTADDQFEAVFEDLDIEIDEDEEITLEVWVDINDTETGTFDSGTTLSATTTGSAAAWDVEDENGEDVTPDGSATGDTMTLVSSGILVSNGDASGEDNDFGTSGSETGTFTINFDVDATEGDFYIFKGADIASSASSGVIYTIYQDGTASTTLVSGGFATDDLDSSSETGDTSDYFIVREGDSRTFTLTVELNPPTTGFYEVELEAVRYDASEDNSAVDDSTLLVPDEDEFETGTVQLNA